MYLNLKEFLEGFSDAVAKCYQKLTLFNFSDL